MAIFTGAATALVTPFTEDMKVNYNKLEELVDYQIDNGIDALVICGTTGEASTLTEEEHLECIRVATKRANKRVPIIAGTGSNCTETAKYLSREACKAGADALLVVTPYYNKATQRGLYEHYSEIASAVDKPIILYNVPGRTGCNITGDTILKILQNVDNVVGIKEASGNITQVAEIMKRVDCNIDLYSGNDDQVLPVLSLGGKGVISVMSNLLPQEMHDLVYRFLEGDPRGSLDMQLKYFDVMKSLFSEVNPIPVKAAMNLMGFDVGSLRRPLTYMEPENLEKLKRDMQTVGLI
jgi:4-hydroxy-tetrahydrodipicolinate synthase